MGRPKLPEEEKAIRIKGYRKKYSTSEKGIQRQKDANMKYQQTEKYKNYRREYYLRTKKQKEDQAKINENNENIENIENEVNNE